MSSALTSRLAAQFAAQMGYPKEDDNAMAEYRLMSYELFWRDHFLWLKDKGYLLRPRYHPDWVASWKGAKKSYLQCEDGQIFDVSRRLYIPKFEILIIFFRERQ